MRKHLLPLGSQQKGTLISVSTGENPVDDMACQLICECVLPLHQVFFCLLLLNRNVDYYCCLCSSFNSCDGKWKKRGLVVNLSYSRNASALFCSSADSAAAVWQHDVRHLWGLVGVTDSDSGSQTVC